MGKSLVSTFQKIPESENIVELWINDEPLDSTNYPQFTASTITNSEIANYDFFILQFWTRNQWNLSAGYRTTIISRQKRMPVDEWSVILDFLHVFYYRYYKIQNDTITFSNVAGTMQYNGATINDNEYGTIIPIALYGLK